MITERNVATSAGTPAARKPERTSAAATLYIAVALGILTSYSPAQAQEATTLRSPLIPGALYTAPQQAVTPDLPPTPGSGSTPLPVTPGQLGNPVLPASALRSPAGTVVPVPATSPLDQSQLNEAISPYLTAPPSTPGVDPGVLPGTTSGYRPSALLVPVPPAGSNLTGNAPQHKWGGQTSKDFGLHRARGAQTTDFGQALKKVAKVQPAPNEDGPRPLGANGGPNQPNRPGAQQTTDLYGNRVLFHGNQHSVMTIAPY